ncbi:RimJ/RimL family protein N-acetyltransferase [Actinoplanes octamycinicus]|uniref:RimJ/RimL family protein N-acetyltransferase n=1 Tax=Actinoplanes octamycinicus TaxID=135948 RepID=A0A7W7MBY1_9ACTN|nr:GNAT family N-acetyltransferase [Actinoplanes octamycinicus]MBB4744255.1 RimJ/RimL family protein N-acetyltransferase [Actinoplanes octamycinicus]GIE56787.1 N-acetyltransferase [Actinoplanes octamycinicus]
MTAVELRPITVADWPAVHEFARLPEVCRYQAWGPNTAAQTEVFVREAAGTWGRSPQSRFVFAVVAGGELAGTAELKLRGPHQAEIGYLLHPRFWGRGLATAAGRGMLAMAFGEHRRHRVFATCDPRNEASARVLSRLGMRFEGRMRETILIRDGWRDSDLYALLSHEFAS